MEEYRNGVQPEGGSKPWQTVSMVYGVVHLVDKYHWVAISINIGDQKILMYDSMRPKRNVSKDGVHEEIRRIANYLDKNWHEGEWRVEFVNDFPQQPDRHSCGVYALKFIEHLIGGTDYKLVDKNKIILYRQEMVVQFHRKEFDKHKVQMNSS